MVIKDAAIVTSKECERADVRIEENKIVEISSQIEPVAKERVVDAKGKYLLPSMVDVGVSLLDGNLRGGTLEKVSKKASSNGFSAVVISSLCTPRIDNEIALEFAKSQAERYSETEIVPLLSGVKESGGLSDCSILLNEGAVGIEFESHIDGNLIRRLMEYASMYGVKLFCRVNDPALQGEGVMHEGSVSSRLGLAGIPAVAESSQVARIGEFADFYGVDVIILGVSTPRSLKICSQNRYLHPQVSLHHLILSDEACDNYDTAAKIWPPLREKSMREELVKILAKSGDAIIGSLHTPVSETAKDAVFSEASYGIEGLENFLPLLYTFLVKDRHIDFPALVEMVSKNPAESVGMGDRKGSVEIGQEADIILFDPDFTSIVKNPSSPYRDMKIFGKVITFKQLTS